MAITCSENFCAFPDPSAPEATPSTTNLVSDWSPGFSREKTLFPESALETQFLNLGGVVADLGIRGQVILTVSAQTSMLCKGKVFLSQLKYNFSIFRRS